MWKAPLCLHPIGKYLYPITQNDLAGSKKLYNFFDSVFAIGKSAKDNSVRYIKQLKVRYGNYTYDADNVIVSAIEKIGTFLQFVNIGYAAEKEHLKEQTDFPCVESSFHLKGSYFIDKCHMFFLLQW